MKLFSGKNLNDLEHIFKYRLFRARCMVENAFGITADYFRCLLTNIISTGYPGDHQELANEDENNHRQVPGAWRQG